MSHEPGINLDEDVALVISRRDVIRIADLCHAQSSRMYPAWAADELNEDQVRAMNAVTRLGQDLHTIAYNPGNGVKRIGLRP